jgi:hypothetical protein
MTRGELLNRIDSRELVEWEAYERISGPLGPERTDQLFAQLTAVIANVNRPKSRKPYRVEEFIPKWDPEAPPERKPEQSPEEMLRAVKSMHRRMTRGGKERQRRGDAS